MIYLQSDKDRTRPHHFDVACAMFGCIDNGFDYRLTSFEEVQSGKFDSLIKSNLFVGSVEFMREVFSRMGRNPRVPINSDRKEDILSMNGVRMIVDMGGKIFVKPIEIKQFTGMVVDKMTISCLKDLDDKFKVMTYAPFPCKIMSEWRAYVQNSKVVDCRNYGGDFRVPPNYGHIESVIQKIKYGKDEADPNRWMDEYFPCAYTIDIGILENGEQMVIEFNDFWAIGNYGMENTLYLRLLRERYFEIVKS